MDAVLIVGRFGLLLLGFGALFLGWYSLLWRDRKAGLSGPEHWFLSLALSALTLAWLSLTAAEFSVFSALSVTLGALAIGATLTAASRIELTKALGFARHGRFPRFLTGPGATAGRRTRIEAIALLGVMIAAAVLSFPPHEWVLGGIDAGGYVNSAATISDTGGFVFQDPEVLALSPDERAALFREERQPLTDGSRLVSFYFRDVDLGTVVPHGFHLYPSLLALAYSVGGIWAVLYVTPLLGLMGVMSLYLLGRRLFGPTVGLLGSLLLALNLAQSYFARYPAAEVLGQVLVLAGTLALVLMLETSSVRLALAAGVLLGLSHVNKIEGVALAACVVALLSVEALRGRWRRQHLVFSLAYGLLILQATLHAVLISSWYSYSVASAVVPKAPSLAVAGICAFAAVVVSRRSLGRLLDNIAARPRPLLALCGAVVGLAALYAFFIRPIGAVTPGGVSLASVSLEAASGIARAQSLVRLSWYVTPLGLLLAVAGAILVLLRHFDRRVAFVLGMVLLDGAVWIAEPLIYPEHFYAARRWVPLLVPGCALFAACAIRALRPRGWPRAWLAAPLGLTAILGVSLLSTDLPFVFRPDYQGAISTTEQFAARFDDRAVLIFDNSDVSRRVSVPAQYLWKRTSFLAFAPLGEDDLAVPAVRDWLAQGRPVYWITAASAPSTPRWPLSIEHAFDYTISLPAASGSFDKLPERVGVFSDKLMVYQVLPK